MLSVHTHNYACEDYSLTLPYPNCYVDVGNTSNTEQQSECQGNSDSHYRWDRLSWSSSGSTPHWMAHRCLSKICWPHIYCTCYGLIQKVLYIFSIRYRSHACVNSFFTASSFPFLLVMECSILPSHGVLLFVGSGECVCVPIVYTCNNTTQPHTLICVWYIVYCYCSSWDVFL